MYKMESSKYDGPIIHSESINGVKLSPSYSQPDYSSKPVQDALQRLASIDLIDLCNEAKIEHCRASRDLRSCDRLVDNVLTSCGHASLCAECSQRCESCPICRTPLLKKGNILHPRLYNEFVESGLISKACDDKCRDREDDEANLTADVQRLYSLFDVAMENNLCCLICQYVTDVCMDESAVSSDPIIAFLLDEVVVKNWCKRAFKNIIDQVRGIYNLEIGEMLPKLGMLLKISAKLAGLSNVLEVLDLSFKNTHSAKLDDLHQLQESILKTKQHMEVMMWCIRHRFLEDTSSQHSDIYSWRKVINKRKSTAVNRSWPEAPGESTEHDNSLLFIEDALYNLELDKGYEQSSAIELEVASLQKDGGLSLLRSKIEGVGGCYPFENVRAAVDMLFLYGSYDVVVAKRAIFLYYLFDRYWTIPDEEWRHIVDDFAATFSIARQSLLESCAFYLLDDHSDGALQEACRLLPEISGPESHPKIARVLLERQNPDVALMFLRWCGHDHGAHLVSLSEAVTAVRVRVECGLLTEAFMYQRMLCVTAKEKELMHKSPVDASDTLEGEYRSWRELMFVLVTEICLLCIRRSLVDRIIELPWNPDEEMHLHKCLLDCAVADPSTTAGSLLVVYYLQRHRYIDAYYIDRKLQTVEEDFVSKNDVDENILLRINSSAKWRAGLVNKHLELLPEVEQQQLKAGNLPKDTISSGTEADCGRGADMLVEQDQVGANYSASSALQSSLLLPIDHKISFQSYSRQNPNAGYTQSEFFDFGSTFSARSSFFTHSERVSKTAFGSAKNFMLDDMMSPGNRSVRRPAFKNVNRTSSTGLQGGHHEDGQVNEISSPVELNGMYGQFPKGSPPNSCRIMAKPTRTPSSTHGLLYDSSSDRYKTASGKRLSLDPEGPRNVVPSSDAIDFSWSQDQNGSPAADFNTGGAPRWRSDETSDDEELPTRRILRSASLRVSRRLRR